MSKEMKTYEPTDEQKRVITTTEGKICVIAVPGSGKTTVILKRIEYLIREKNVQSEKILAVTFTKRAANHLSIELQKLLKKEHNVYTGTFHKLCQKILKEYSCDMRCKILDETKEIEILSDIYQKFLDCEIDEEELRRISTKIQEIKQKSSHKEESYARFFFDTGYESAIEKLLMETDDSDLQIFYLYLQQQCGKNLFDYEDLLQAALYLLNINEKFRETIQKKYQYVLCDEYQDVNSQQDELMRILSQKSRNLTVVGDDDQNIYSWRGSEYTYIQKFWGEAQQMSLSMNFRSTPEILNVAECVIEKNKDRIRANIVDSKVQKQMVTNNANGKKPEFIIHKTNMDEAQWIAEKIKENKLEKVAILVRTKKQIPAIENSLKRESVPYEKTITGFDKIRTELDVFKSYLQMIEKKEIEDEDFLMTVNYPRRGFGKTALTKLKQCRLPGQGLYYVLRDHVKEMGNQKLYTYCKEIDEIRAGYHTTNPKNKLNSIDVVDKICDLVFPDQRLQKKIQSSKQDEEQIQRRKWGTTESIVRDVMRKNMVQRTAEINNVEYDEEQKKYPILNRMERVSLVEVIDDYDYFITNGNRQEDRVRILTVHAAKGEEYDNVFIPGMVENVFPGTVLDAAGYEEERRIFYVAITRAIKNLYISSYRECKGTNNVRPSSLLGDIEPGLLNIQSI